MEKQLVDFVRDVYKTSEFIPLHAPVFMGNEKKYVADAIDSTFVSSVGVYVDRLERQVEEYTGCARAVATVNGTSALHAGLVLSGVMAGDLVITQPLTFIATCNAISYCFAEPVFVDVSKKSLGLCPAALSEFLQQHAILNDNGSCIHRDTGKVIRACVPMHTFGHPAEMDEIVTLCERWNIAIVEDAAESLGSFYKGQHTGLKGIGVVSFNGNKVMTTGGGGMLLCPDVETGEKAKHLTTTAKIPHAYEYKHDRIGFNYRMPNLNAALGCAQLEMLPDFLASKRQLAMQYKKFFQGSDFAFVEEPEYAQSNYWLNAILCPSKEAREKILKTTNDQGVMTRPVWALMDELEMYQNALAGDLSSSRWLADRLVNIPSSPVLQGG